MKSIKILHTGDLHLGSPMLNMGSKSTERKKELLHTFSKIIDLAIEESVDLFLIAGDLFDTSNPDAEILDYVACELERLGDIKVFVVLGNHDYGLKCNFPSNVYVFKDYVEKISIGDVDIYGVSFSDNHCNNCIIEGLTADNTEKVNVLLIHGDIGTSSVYNPISTEQIIYSKMDYMALGHQHTDFIEKVGGTTVTYCGIPEGRAFDECGEKGVIIAQVGVGYAECKFVPVCKRKYIARSVDITGAEDNLEIANRISKELDGVENAYCVILKGEKSTFVDCSFLKDFLEKEFYFVEVDDLSEERGDDGYTLKNLFMEKCKNEKALKYGLSALRGEKVSVE